ncbi:unnamed protein product [Camellia sinensis]
MVTHDAQQSLRKNDSMGKLSTEARSVPEEDANVTSRKVSGIDVAPESVVGKPKDERQLKREKRKHANRQFVRRSRLRKQAETEELMKRYETVKVENITLKFEMK